MCFHLRTYNVNIFDVKYTTSSVAFVFSAQIQYATSVANMLSLYYIGHIDRQANDSYDWLEGIKNWMYLKTTFIDHKFSIHCTILIYKPHLDVHGYRIFSVQFEQLELPNAYL